MKICLVYDCLFPYTVGGAERWYRNLGERLAAEGHEVTYITLRQWPRGERGDVPGVDVVAVGPRMELYVNERRRIAPPLVFGLGVLAHLVRHGRRYDVVHTASFPYFSLLAAGLLRPVFRYRLVVDWHEVWSREYWREYLGRAGWIGALVQHLCARIRQRAFCFSRLHAKRLREIGLRGEPQLLEGEFTGPRHAAQPRPAEPLVVFAGRHIPEKRAPAVVPAVRLAASRVPGLRGVIFGDGPERDRVLEAIAESDGEGAAPIEAPGFVSPQRVDDTLADALCMLLPSRREGYGMIVVEASSLGVPSIVVREPDNAAVELVAEGDNGTIAASAAPADLADAIVRIHEAGAELRDSTAAWYERNAVRLSLESSLEQVVAVYGAAAEPSARTSS